MQVDSNTAEGTEMPEASQVEVLNDVETPSTESESSVANDPAAEPAATPAPVAADTAQPAAPAYTPDFKVKIKGKEFEIDEMFRGLIKDADSEKKVKEFFEKAYGIDFVKQDRKALKDEHEGFKSQV